MTFQKDCPSYGIAVRHIHCVAVEGHELLLGAMHVVTDIHTSVQCNIFTVCWFCKEYGFAVNLCC